MIRHTRPTRRGFTLVELLVSAALTILMMAVVAVAFQAALKAHSDLHSVSSLADQLRAADVVLTRDLTAHHLWDDETGRPVRVSEVPRHATATFPGWRAPSHHGYFFIQQETAPGTPRYADEGFENGKSSFRATNHVLAMTVRLPADVPERAFAARAPSGFPQNTSNNLVANPINLRDLDATNPRSQFVSRWAEVLYFLSPTPLTTNAEDAPAGTAPLPLFTLRRRQWVLTPEPVTLVHNPNNVPTTPPTTPGMILDPTITDVDLSTLFPEISATLVSPPPLPSGGGYQMWTTNTPSSVKANRFGGTNTPPAGLGDGSDVLLSNVISFQVRVMSDAAGATGNPVWFHPTTAPPPTNMATAVNPFEFHDLGLWVRDNRYAPTPPPVAAKPVWFNTGSGEPPPAAATFDTFANLTTVPLPVPPPSPPNPATPHPTTLPAGPPQQTQVVRQVRAVEVVVRVYDLKTRLTRQITIRRDL